jgi:hypothetical protein
MGVSGSESNCVREAEGVGREFGEDVGMEVWRGGVREIAERGVVCGEGEDADGAWVSGGGFEGIEGLGEQGGCG